MVTTVQQVVARQEALDAIEDGMSLEDQFAAAFRVTYNHWLCSDVWQQFHAACEAVYLANPDEQERILEEVEVIVRMFGGYTADLSSLHIPENHDPIGIFKIYKRVQHDQEGV